MVVGGFVGGTGEALLLITGVVKTFSVPEPLVILFFLNLSIQIICLKNLFKISSSASHLMIIILPIPNRLPIPNIPNILPIPNRNNIYLLLLFFTSSFFLHLPSISPFSHHSLAGSILDTSNNELL